MTEEITNTNAPEERTFSQAEVNQIVGERLAREREKIGDPEALAAREAALAEREKTFNERIISDRLKAEKLPECADYFIDRAKPIDEQFAALVKFRDTLRATGRTPLAYKNESEPDELRGAFGLKS